MLLNIAIMTDSLFYPKEWFGFPLIFILGQIWVVIGEEYGWRGFALPILQEKLGTINGSILLGIMWALWHLPMFFIPGSPQFSNDILYDLSEYVLLLVFWTIIMAALYNLSGRGLILCFLFHAFANISAFSIRIPGKDNIMIFLYIPVVIIAIIMLTNYSHNETNRLKGRNLHTLSKE